MKHSGKKKQAGVVAIETALGLLAFLMMIFYWIEVSYMGFVSSLMDYAASEASRGARTSAISDDEYLREFEAILDDTGSVWANFIEPEAIEVSLYYYDDVEHIACEEQDTEFTFCNPGNSSYHSPIAIYRLSYPYEPLFVSFFFDAESTMKISREVIAIQEYERSEFDG